MPTLTLLPPGPRAPAAGLHPDRVGLGALARSEANPTGRPPSALSVFPSLGRTGDGGSRYRGPGAGGPGGPGRPFPSHFQRKGNEMSLPTRWPSPTGHRTGRSSKHHLGSAGASHKTLSPQTRKSGADAARESEREDGAGTGRGLLVRGQMSAPSTVPGRHSANTEGTNRQMTKNRLG